MENNFSYKKSFFATLENVFSYKKNVFATLENVEKCLSNIGKYFFLQEKCLRNIGIGLILEIDESPLLAGNAWIKLIWEKLLQHFREGGDLGVG